MISCAAAKKAQLHRGDEGREGGEGARGKLAGDGCGRGGRGRVEGAKKGENSRKHGLGGFNL